MRRSMLPGNRHFRAHKTAPSSVALRKKAPQKGALPLISAKKANAAAFVVRSTAPGVRFGL